MKRPRAKWTHTLLSLVVLAAIAVYCLFPLYWIVITSFKLPGSEFTLPVEYWPRRFSLESYRIILGPDFRVQNAIKNSLIVSSCVTAGSLFICSLSAYSIARLRFKYRFQSLIAIQAAGMVPAIVTIAPTFILVRSLGLLGDLEGMILPNIVYNIPLGTFLMAAYFAGFTRAGGCRQDGWLRSVFDLPAGDHAARRSRALRGGGDRLSRLMGRVHARFHNQHGPAKGPDGASSDPGLEPAVPAPVGMGIGWDRAFADPGDRDRSSFRSGCSRG